MSVSAAIQELWETVSQMAGWKAVINFARRAQRTVSTKIRALLWRVWLCRQKLSLASSTSCGVLPPGR